ncbi:hypothetical protein Cfor_04861 [Coptotermes formosanus]|uniref:Cytochrome P450 n=1 Tax=Coptotermes formosanus TaxID=36987 RepID=A0A6L2PN25_COPFO|nr:hypothetical protein Cfor_04861 [Coptotermes formosanus]
MPVHRAKQRDAEPTEQVSADHTHLGRVQSHYLPHTTGTLRAICSEPPVSMLSQTYLFIFAAKHSVHLKVHSRTGRLQKSREKWHTHRKMITPTFHFKILDSFVDIFSEKSQILITKLQKEVGSTGFDVYQYVTRCALDIICDKHVSNGCCRDGDGHPGPRSGRDKFRICHCSVRVSVNMLTFRMTLIVPFQATEILRQKIFQQCVLRFNVTTTHNGRYATGWHTLMNCNRQVIQERKRKQLQSKETSHIEQDGDDIGKWKKRVAFLDMLLEAAEDGAKLTDEEIREEVDTFMFEGHDTTSAAVCWTLFLLGLHHDVQDKAYEELEGIFEGSDRPPTMKDLNEMKYLERVIKESLRLYPSVPSFSRLLKEDIEIGGYTIPAGCSIRVSIYMNNRNSDQFPNPEKFDPDNFLPERVAKRHPYAYIPFSAGPRNCIGQKFAMLEEKTMLSYMLRHYRLRSLDKREDINILMELIMRPENGIRLNITPRIKESNKI